MANNPGSPEAIKKGCMCPEMDNRYGLGTGRFDDYGQTFWINEACPLHGIARHKKVKNED